MSKIVWDDAGKHLFETGIDQGVLYVQNNDGTYATGVPWNGLTGITESPSGGEPNNLYADNIKYLSLYSLEEFGATIEAYTYPDEFAQCDGTASLATGVSIGQQARQSFALSYRTRIGNEIQGSDYGYKIHIIYGAKASPSERAYTAINDSPDAITFSWEVTTTPIAVAGFKPTSHLVIDSKTVDSAKLTIIENKLYGSDNLEPTLLTPDVVLGIINGTIQ